VLVCNLDCNSFCKPEKQGVRQMKVKRVKVLIDKEHNTKEIKAIKDHVI